METISLDPVSMSEANRQWQIRPADQRFENLETLHESVKSRRSRSFQYDVNVIDMRVSASESGGLMVAAPAREDSIPTNHGFGQLAQRAGAPAGYLRKLTPELASECLNFGLAKLSTNEESKILATESEDGNSTALASITSPTYGRIWDEDVVSSVRELVDRTAGAFYNPKEWSGKGSGLYASDRDVFMFMIDGGSIVDGESERDQLHRGFFVWNSEVGEATLGIQTFLFRVVCGNHTIWEPEQVKALRIRHTANAPERFVSQALPKLQEYVDLSTDSYRSMVLAAKSFQTPADSDDLVKFLVGNGFTRGEAKRALLAADREEGDHTNLWTIHNGLTSTAREMAHVDARVDLERRAGKLLDLAVAAAA